MSRVVPLRKRLDRYTDKSGKCWLWTGTLNHNGYGLFICVYAGLYGAHRASYYERYGRIPKGKLVLHRNFCHNRRCIKPEHLYLGTHKQNYEDARRLNTHSHGETSGMSKLTRRDVKEIRKQAQKGVYYLKIAKKFGVAQSTVSHIMTGRNWRWLK